MERMTRRVAIAWAGGAAAVVITGNRLASRADAKPPDNEKTRRTEWMAGEWGIMCHWIAPGPAPERGKRVTDLNKAVDAFNLSRFLEQLEESGAGFVMFTIGQNTSYYASPNATLERLAGPGHCSNRDLILELAQGVHKLGKRLIPYIPAEIKRPESLHKPFAWNPADQTEFQRRYTDFVREYSLRYGNLYDAWWYDGCYTWPDFPNSARDFPLWYEAARAGNPDAPVAFNNGCYLLGNRAPTWPKQDYISGECWGFKDGKLVLGRND